MDYSTNIRRTLSSFLLFLSVVIWFLYLYFKLWAFVKAAKSMNYINIQTMSFTIYSFLLVLLPSAIIYSPRHSKRNLFKFVCFIISASLLVGAVGDLITYNFFRNYSFLEGDAIFCNIVVSVPNIYGVLCCLILAWAYAVLGLNIIEKKGFSCLLYLLIVLISIIPPFLYSFTAWNGFPRQTWIEKAAFIIPHQLCILFTLLLSSMSDFTWTERMR